MAIALNIYQGTIDRAMDLVWRNSYRNNLRHHKTSSARVDTNPCLDSYKLLTKFNLSLFTKRFYGMHVDLDT